MLDLKHKLFLGLALAALGVAGIAFRSWIDEHDARLAASAKASAAEQVAASAADRIQELKAQDGVRAAQEAATLEAMQKLVGQIKTSQQIAQWLPQQVPLPQPVTINVPPATAANPSPNAVASIPQADLPALRDYAERCRECAIKLGATQAALESRDEQLREAGAALSAKDNEIAVWQKAAKGTVWSRTKSALKYVVIGGGIALAAICGTGHCK